jgi:hypothetical protein
MVLYLVPRGAVNFKEATDILTSTPTMTLGRIAEVFGKEMHTIARARMDGPNSRRPPAEWASVLAGVAREHAKSLRDHANELEHLAKQLESSQ